MLTASNSTLAAAAPNPYTALSGADLSKKSEIRAAAEEFESVFLNNMLQSMFTSLEDGGVWGSGNGAEAWQGLLVDEYAKTITEAGGIGLADSVERELLALQEFGR